MGQQVAPAVACKQCGKLFYRSMHFRVYCSHECQKESAKAATRDSMKRIYWADPVAANAALKAWRDARPGYQAMLQKRSSLKRGLYCIICGRQKMRFMSEGLDPATFICSRCQIQARRTEWLMSPCRICGEPVGVTTRRRKLCDDCIGLLTRAAEILGITHERVRQLMHKKIEKAEGMGFVLSRHDAVELIKAERLGQPLPKVRLRLKAPVA